MPKIWRWGAALVFNLMSCLPGHLLPMTIASATTGPKVVEIVPTEEPTRPIGG